MRSAVALPFKAAAFAAFLYLTYGVFLAPPGYLLELLK